MDRVLMGVVSGHRHMIRDVVNRNHPVRERADDDDENDEGKVA